MRIKHENINEILNGKYMANTWAHIMIKEKKNQELSRNVSFTRTKQKETKKL